MKNSIALFILGVLLVSCNSTPNRVITDDFPDNRWPMGEAKEIDLSVGKDQTADLYVLLGYTAGTQFTEVPVSVEITAPDGSITLMSADIKIADENGKSLGDCAGDVCDVATLAKKDMKLLKGSYTFKIKNKFKKSSYLPNVLSLGIKLDKKDGSE